MDDRTRQDLLARLADARTRELAARQGLQAHAAGIDGIRQQLGNPYFYSGRSAEDAESQARFSGYASHEPARRLYVEWHDARRQITSIRQQMREAGINTD